MNTKLNKILLAILIYLATIILITTIFAFTQKKQNRNNSLFTKDLQPNQLEQIDNSNKLESFTGLGRIRISTHPDSKGKNVPLVISPWFSYQKGDEQFFEEFNQSLHRLGRILLIISLCLLLSVPFVVGALNRVMPELGGFLSGMAKVGIIYIPVAIVEFLVYTPMLGVGGSYISFLTGNVTNMKIPIKIYISIAPYNLSFLNNI